MELVKLKTKYLPAEKKALARNDVDLDRVVFNPKCSGKHERTTYDIQTCPDCLDHSAKIQKEKPREISIGTIGTTTDETIPTPIP